MMGNKWMQGGILFGAAIGLFSGSFLSFIHPFVPFGLAYPLGFWAMWICASAKGTDGWGGPWVGPKEQGSSDAS